MALIAGLSLLVVAQSAGMAVRACSANKADEIIVCGTRERRSPYRLPKLPDNYDPAVRNLRAQTTIGGIRASAQVTSTPMLQGEQSKRIMLTIGTAF